MMEIYSAGLIFILLLLIVEFRLSSKWSQFYFNNGILLYSNEIKVIPFSVTIDEINKLLNEKYINNGYAPSINFKKINNNNLAFREKLFEFTLFSYTPIMHGSILVGNDNVKILGHANWFPVGFACLWYFNILQGFRIKEDFVFLIAPIIIFGAIYLIQAKRYKRIANQIIKRTVGTCAINLNSSAVLVGRIAAAYHFR